VRRFLVVIIVGFLMVRMAPAQNAADESTVAVRMFSTRIVHQATFSPLGFNATMRRCPQCPEKKIETDTTLQQMYGDLRIAGDTLPRKQVEFLGAFRIRIDELPEAETAAGRWIVENTAAGLRILLVTSVERYVRAALNGEAASNEPLESSKAMAVVARTFALANRHRHAADGFDLCDSTHCQALRFSATRPEVEEAVRATTGETLWYGANRAEVYATQHCGGEAEDVADVWPAVHASYLRAHADPYCLRRSSASWHADIGIAELARILTAQHWKIPEKIETIRVIKRTPAGRAQVLEVLGQGARADISASGLHFAIDRALGWNQLRSDWYEITLNNGMVHFAGKGYGHGVGLCQAGSFEMAVEGHSYREILNFYFPGTRIGITSKDAGWKGISANGWTLSATDASQNLLAAGNAAWAKAQSIFPPQAAVHPRVRLMPTTELFRQATDEPGWMLASTHGASIVLQPLRVLLAHGGESSTLLHEFLHVLVEQETTPQTPLWLREGLVGLLAADNNPPSRSAMQPSQIESALAHPVGITESQQAHAASQQLVRRLIHQYGIQTVRGWLRSGVPPTALAP
jgi:stage II sporulation protein D